MNPYVINHSTHQNTVCHTTLSIEQDQRRRLLGPREDADLTKTTIPGLPVESEVVFSNFSLHSQFPLNES